MTNPLINSLNATTNIGDPKSLFKKRDSINILNNTILNFNKTTNFENNQNMSNNTLNTIQNLGSSIINSNSFINNLIPGMKGSNVNMNTAYNGINNPNMSMIRSKGNLRSAMESLDLIPEKDEIENLIANNINNTNLFKNNTSSFKSSQKGRYGEDSGTAKSLDEVNLFTKTILGTINWGDSYTVVSNNNKESVENTTYFKPHKKEFEREIGKSILNAKLPRSRLPTKAFEMQNQNRMNKGSFKKDSSGDKERILNSTSLSFLKPSAFSKVFNNILARKNN